MSFFRKMSSILSMSRSNIVNMLHQYEIGHAKCKNQLRFDIQHILQGQINTHTCYNQCVFKRFKHLTILTS